MPGGAWGSTVGDGAGPVLKLLDALEELDDVQEVHSNFDLPDDVMAELAAG